MPEYRITVDNHFIESFNDDKFLSPYELEARKQAFCKRHKIGYSGVRIYTRESHNDETERMIRNEMKG